MHTSIHNTSFFSYNASWPSQTPLLKEENKKESKHIGSRSTFTFSSKVLTPLLILSDLDQRVWATHLPAVQSASYNFPNQELLYELLVQMYILYFLHLELWLYRMIRCGNKPLPVGSKMLSLNDWSWWSKGDDEKPNTCKFCTGRSIWRVSTWSLEFKSWILLWWSSCCVCSRMIVLRTNTSFAVAI